MAAGYGGGWVTRDAGEGIITLVVVLLLEHLMPEMTVF